jgi:hypothetical protein
MLLTRTIICFFSSLLLSVQVAGAAEPVDVIDHQPFQKILKEHVNKKGMVAYKALKASDAAIGLKTYLGAVAAADLKGHKRKAKLAFYINAYNALVVQAILDQLPTSSVMKVDGFFKKTKYVVAGKKLTLDALENKIIRPKFKEPRIHFVLVCGAKSCPRLRRHAMTAKNLNRQLKKAAQEFVPKATQIEGDKVTTSQLFNWFKDDFVAAKGSVGAYLAEYLPEHAETLKSTGSIAFSHYDWALNAR